MVFIHKMIESNLAIKNMKVKKSSYFLIFFVTYWNIMYNLVILSNLNIIFKICDYKTKKNFFFNHFKENPKKIS
jgi:hypothetical protein